MSIARSDYKLTNNQILTWEDIRKDLVSEWLPNPKKMQAKIKRDGPTFLAAERDYKTFTEKKKGFLIDEKKATKTISKIEDVFSTVIQHSVNIPDARTSVKLSMINKNLQKALEKTTNLTQRKNRTSLLTPTLNILIILDIYNRYYEQEKQKNPEYQLILTEPNEIIQHLLMQEFVNRLKYVRKLTQKHISSEYVNVQTNNLPLVKEDLKYVLSKFKKYKQNRYTTNRIIDETIKLFNDIYDSKSKTLKAPLTDLQKKIKENIYNYYDISEDIAIFYSCYLLTYAFITICEYYFLVAKMNTYSNQMKLVLTITENILDASGTNYTILTQDRLNYFISSGNYLLLQKYIDNGLDPNYIMYYEGRKVPLITLLKEKNAKKFIEIVSSNTK